MRKICNIDDIIIITKDYIPFEYISKKLIFYRTEKLKSLKYYITA
jgi:hypothetical protein